ncbi:MAG: LamG domain-containing protein [Myxococcales bacterium]|nr:LamG domain-containing protein [Myxococcales bacterium]
MRTATAALHAMLLLVAGLLAADPASARIGHWQLDETSGTTVTDAVGGNDGTYRNGPVLGGAAGACDGGSSVGFDGSNDYAEIPHVAGYLVDDGTVAFWFKADTIRRSGLFSKDSSGYDTGGHLTIFLEADGRIYVRLQSTSADHNIYSSTQVTAGGWHHVAFTFGAGGMELYLDGASVGTNGYTGGLATTSGGVGNREPIVLGASSWTSGNQVATPTSLPFDGSLDEVEFYDDALGSGAVAALADCAASLDSHWLLDETTGTTMADAIGGNDGTYRNGVTLAQSGGACDAGTAVSFDGSNDYADAPHVAGYLVDDGTVAFWFKADTIRQSGLFSKDSSDFDTGGHLTVLLEADGRVSYRLQSTTASYHIYSSSSVSAGSWHHVAVRFGAGGMALYLDGVSEATNAHTGGLGTSSGGSGNAEPIVIGANSWGSGNLVSTPLSMYFDGAMDDVRFYDGALSAGEIQALAICSGNPLIHFDFEEGAGTTAVDSSGNGHDATLTNMDPSTDWVAGRCGSALDFDGTNDHAPSAGTFTPPSAGTVTLWMKVPGTPGSVGRIFGVSDGFEIRHMPTGILHFDLNITNVNDTFVTSVPVTAADRWYHVAAVFNAANDTFSVYLDGVLDNSGTLTLTTEPAGTLTLGRRAGYNTEYFRGTLDDFRVYDTELSAAEIAALASGAGCNGRVARWGLDETSGTTAVESELGNDGTYRNGVTLAQPGGACDSGTSVDFDGSNDHVEIPHSNDYLLADGTVSFWFKADTIRQTGLLSKDSSDYDTGGHLTFLLEADGQVHVRFQSTSASYNIYSGTTVAAGSWHHVAFTFGSGGMVLYLDGTSVGTHAYTGGLGTTSGGSGNQEPIVLGANSWGSGNLVATPLSMYLDGSMDEVEIHDYALDATQVQSLFDCASVDHFVIGHDGAGVHCLIERVTVTAVDAAGNPVTDYTGTVDLDTGSGFGNWRNAPWNNGSFSDPTGDDGLASYTFADADDGVATFGLTYLQGPTPINVLVSQANDPTLTDDDTEGTMTWSPSGFTVTANLLSNPPPNPIDDPIPAQTAGSAFWLYLAAYGTTPTQPKCGVIETYTGWQTLKFGFIRDDPTTGTIPVTIDGNTIGTNPAAASYQNVRFINGRSRVAAKYKDVGVLRIYMWDDTVPEPAIGIIGVSNRFVVKPADFFVTAVQRPDLTANPGIAVPTGEVFVAAGAPFRVTLEARDAEGDRTPNYGNEATPEGIVLTAPTLVAPSGGRNGSNDDGAIGNGSAFSAVAPAGTFRATTVFWDEVGAITLQASVADGSYLGAGDVTGTETGTVGRFRPDHFDVSLNAPTFDTACAAGAFGYVGQPFGYMTGGAPVITATAQAVANTTTRNYAGTWFRLTNGSLANQAYAAFAGTLDTTGAPGTDPVILPGGDGTATLTFDSGSGFFFQRGAAPVPPFDADVALSVDVIDLDGAAYAANPARFGQATAGNGIPFDAGKQMRWGRLAFENAHGSEVVPLQVPLRAEYWLGAGYFGTNVADVCTALSVGNLQTTPTPGSLVSTPSFGNVPLASGDAGLSLSAPGAGNAGTIDLEQDLSSTGDDLGWLRFDWEQDGGHDENPTGRATFGVFSGDGPVIFHREVY